MQLIRGFRQIVILTVISRVLGMIRDMVFAFYLGASSVMDGWVVAFMIPNLSRRLFGEGAAASSLIPVYSQELERGPQHACRLASTVVTVVCVLLTILVVAGEIFIWSWYAACDLEGTRLKLALTGVMLPYMIVVCAAAIMAGVLNAHHHFAAPAAAPVLLNLFLIVSLGLAGWLLKAPPRVQVFVVAGGVIVAGLIQMGIQLPPLWSRGIHLRPAWDVKSDAFRKVLILMAPMVLGLTATQINTLVGNLVALWLSGSAEKGQFFHFLSWRIKYPLWEGAVSQLFYAQRLYQFPLGVFGISLATAIFPVMSTDAARKDYRALCQTISRGLQCTLFIGLPATVGLVLLCKPVVKVLFQRGQFTSADTMGTAYTLIFYLLGLSGYIAQQLVARAFYSLQESSVPAKSALVAVAINACLNLTLVWRLGTGGLAASTALCSYVQVVILYGVLWKRFGSQTMAGVPRATLQTLAATSCMALTVLAIMHGMRDRSSISMVIVAVVAGTVIFLLASRLLKIEMLSLLTGARRYRVTAQPEQPSAAAGWETVEQRQTPDDAG